METTLYHLTFMNFFYYLSWFNLIILTNSLSLPKQAICHDHERSALLQFKQSFSLNPSASLEPFARSKVEFWKIDLGENTDCCLWDGVGCNKVNRHVISLDLGSSFLYGSINSSSSLFSLIHLQWLNLADNDFNYSQIPSAFGRLSKLKHLNLSSSVFAGEIPRELLGLSELVSLDLAINIDRQSSQGLLRLEPPIFRSLPQNFTKLRTLYLGLVKINSIVPKTLASMSSLTILSLHDCALYGDFPKSIFLLPNLEKVWLAGNENLTGYLPEFCQGSHLKELDLSDTGFSGSIPASVANLSQLTILLLRGTKFTEGKMSRLAKLTKLNKLWLDKMNLQGELPSFLANLSQLTDLRLGSNQLSGQIPSWLFNLTQLTILDLSFNELQGRISSLFSKLKNLENLSLHENNLTGTVEAGIFLNHTRLNLLNLSGNKVSFLVKDTTTTNATLPKFRLLALASCNLRKLPDFLQFQDELEVLSLADNMIDHMPEWMWKGSNATSRTLPNHPILPWPNLMILHLSNNILKGSLPIPPPKIAFYYAANNRLTGNIPHIFCGLSYLSVVDLSDNSLSGTIPTCFGKFSNSLTVMKLKGNKFQGTIPQVCTTESNLEMLDLSQNQLEGQFPRSLGNCSRLQILDIGNNHMKDYFPFWLGALLNLQVLVLSSNMLHGTLTSPAFKLQFPKLRIFDVSNNSLTGYLPYEYFEAWSAMKIESAEAAYMTLIANIQVLDDYWLGIYPYSMKITNKGVKREYEKIINIFVAVDLSQNKFRGEIPESVGSLKGVQSLNLSYNELTGGILASLGNLTHLESLDLSQNRLSGQIPQQLAQLNFLEFLNVSCNNLSGIIPSGRQFSTFQNISYEGNSELCGEPLSMQCGGREVPSTPPPSTFDIGKDYEFPSSTDWIVMFTGIGSGLVVGLICGTNLTLRNHEWFVEKFGKWPKKWQSISSFERGRRNSSN